MEFYRPEYWSGQPFPSPGDLLNPGIEPRSPALQVVSLPAEPQGKPKNTGVGSLSLLQGIFLTQESNQGLLHCRQILYQLSYQGSHNNNNGCSKLPVRNNASRWGDPKEIRPQNKSALASSLFSCPPAYSQSRNVLRWWGKTYQINLLTLNYGEPRLSLFMTLLERPEERGQTRKQANKPSKKTEDAGNEETNNHNSPQITT